MLWFPLWYDEAFTKWLSMLPMSRLLEATAGDVHPPLFYIVAWLSAHIFGASAFAVRLPSLVFGTASVVLFGAVLSEIHCPTRVKDIAIWTAVFSPWLAYYSTEGRMYAMLLFFVLTAIYGVLRGELWLFVAGTVLGLYTHNMMILYLPVLGILFLLKSGWAETIRAGIITAVLYAPWLPSLVGQLHTVKTGFWVQPLTTGRVIGSLYEASAEIATNANTLIITACIVFALLAIGTVEAIKHRVWNLLGVAVSPVIVAIIISLCFSPIMTTPPRVLIGASPFLIALIAWGAYWLYQTAGRATLALLIVPAVMWVNVFMYPTKHIPEYAALNLSGNCYHLEPVSIVTAAEYAPGCINYGWSNDGPIDLSLTPQTVRAMGMNIVPFEDMPAGRIYLFFTDLPTTRDTERVVLARILKNYPSKLLLKTDEYGIKTTYLYEVEKPVFNK